MIFMSIDQACHREDRHDGRTAHAGGGECSRAGKLVALVVDRRVSAGSNPSRGGVLKLQLDVPIYFVRDELTPLVNC